jgi:uncharacterized protein
MAASITIRSISDGVIRIAEDTYDRTIAMTLSTVIDSWPEKSVEDLIEGDFEALFEAQPEVIVLGTGDSGVFAPRDLMFAMARRGVGFEVMDTKAAARTFNVLASEGRQVAAVLYL